MRDLSKQNILFFTRTMELGGTENVILQLCETFKPLVNKIVVCSCGGVNEKKLKELNIKHYTIPDIENKNPSCILTVSKMLKKIIKNVFLKKEFLMITKSITGKHNQKWEKFYFSHFFVEKSRGM